jgi:hypothetical protein
MLREMSDDDNELELMQDDEVMALLAEALGRADPVPAHVMDNARAAFTWRTIDAELAELVFDSAIHSAGVRSDEANRQVTFRASDVEIEIMVLEDRGRRLVGQLVPARDATVELVGEDGKQSARSDRLGRFSFDRLGVGPARLVVRGADGRRVVQTDWVRL